MISENEFRDLAMLARLDPDDKSLSNLREDFNKILDFVARIQELHEESASEFHPPNETKNVTRPDEAWKMPELSKIADLAPEWEAGHFVVPGVLDQEH